MLASIQQRHKMMLVALHFHQYHYQVTPYIAEQKQLQPIRLTIHQAPETSPMD
jgi:hypothetical protein